ncbi:MAG: T9SS type A sorting domain-containing protein [Ignavibacteria bacterium]|jgi:tetratricopeptide (TPR) repeat protein
MVTFKSIKVFLTLVILILFSFTEKMHSQTIYTPEGRAVSAMILSGTPYYDNAWAQYWINYYSLDATIIDDPTRAHNCHGYAWAVTEGIGDYWLQNDEELKFFSDSAYSNDGQPSYISTSEGSATHGCYEPYSDHSIRVIQDGYPVSSSGSQTQVSKWNDGPLVRHGLRGDVYAAYYAANHDNNPVPINFRVLKTTHTGTLSNYPKTWIGAGGKTHTITSDILCPNNLTIKSGVTVNLNDYSIIIDGGTLSVSGSATVNGLRAKLGPHGENGYCGLIQTAIDNSDLNDNIYIVPGTHNEDIRFADKSSTVYVYGDGQYSTIVNGKIGILNSSYPQLYYLAARSLSISSCSNARVEEVLIIPWSEEEEGCLFTFNSTNLYLGGITLNNVPDAYAGYFFNTSGEIAGGNGTYFQNHELATWYIGGSSFTLGGVEFCNNEHDILTDGTSYVYVQNGGTFSGDPYTTTIGNVTWGNYDICSGLLKNSTSLSGNTGTTNEEFGKINSSYHGILSKVNDEISKGIFDKNKYSGDFQSIIEECKSFIGSNTASVFASTALNLAVHSYKQIEDYEGLKSFAEAIMNDKELSILHGKAKHKLIDYYIYKKDYDKALKTADEILLSYGGENSRTYNEELIGETLLSKGFLYEYVLGESEKAIEVYGEMLASYPENAAAKFAKNQLRNLGQDVIIPSQEEITTDIEEELTLSNYPNPFNPTTTINYSIPSEGRVQVRIYDILGREVETLVNEIGSAGTHKVEWNGSRYSSGIYFYSITFMDKTLYKKMLMVK